MILYMIMLKGYTNANINLMLFNVNYYLFIVEQAESNIIIATKIYCFYDHVTGTRFLVYPQVRLG